MRRFSVHILVISMVAGFYLLSCKARTDGELKLSDDQGPVNPAWFVGGDQIIAVCINTSPMVKQRMAAAGLDSAKLRDQVGSTYAKWVEYVSKRRGVLYLESPNADTLIARGLATGIAAGKLSASTPLNKVYDHVQHEFMWGLPAFEPDLSPAVVAAMFPLALAFVEDCSKADLEVDFGTSPSFRATESVAEESGVVGAALIKSTISSTWKKGAIVLKDDSDQLSYGDLTEVGVVLMHEWGHVLGNAHMTGTIMDSTVLTAFARDAAATRDLSANLRDVLFKDAGSIDQWRQLYAPNDCVGQSICYINGIGFNDLPGAVTINYKGALHSMQFFSLDFFSVLLDPGLSALGQFEVKPEASLGEVFQRPRDIAPKPLRMESYVVSNWRTRNYLVKIMVNTNQDETSSSVMLQAECHNATVTIFQGQYPRLYNISAPRTWPKVLDSATYQSVRSAQNCATNTPDFSGLSNSGIDADVKSAIEQLSTPQNWSMGPATDHQPTILPAKESWCATLKSHVSMCLWRRGKLGLVQFKDGQGTSLTSLSPYDAASLAAGDPSLHEGWTGMMPWKDSPQAPGTAAMFRLGVSRNLANRNDASSPNFVLDVSYTQGIWYPAARGSLLSRAGSSSN